MCLVSRLEEGCAIYVYVKNVDIDSISKMFNRFLLVETLMDDNMGLCSGLMDMKILIGFPCS